MRQIKKICILIICIANLEINAQVSKEEFIQNQNNPKLSILFPSGNNAKLRFSEISNDKKLLATANWFSNDIMIWDIGSAKLLKKINTSKDKMGFLLEDFKFSADNKKIVIGYKIDFNKEVGIIVCDLASELYFNLKTGTNSFIVEPNVNELIIAYNNKFEVYSLGNYELIKEIKNKTGSYQGMLISPNRSYLAALSNNRSNHTFAIFNYNSGKLIAEIEQRKSSTTKSGKSFILGYIPASKFITDTKILINFDNGDYAVYDIINKVELALISNPHKSINTLTALSKNGNFLITTTKEDKTLKLWDLNSQNKSTILKHEMLLKDIPENIYFYNDSIVNYIAKDGIIKININTWSICEDKLSLGVDKSVFNKLMGKDISGYADYESISEMGTVMVSFKGEILEISEVDNIIITSDQYGNIHLYSGNYDISESLHENEAIQTFKSFIPKTNNMICLKNELYTCRDKEIRRHNLNTGLTSIFKSIDPSEEEEEINDVLVFHGESSFIGVEYLKNINCIAIAKHQNSETKIIFQSLNAQGSNYTVIPEVPEMENRKMEILGLKSSPNGNFLAVFWGEENQYGKEILFTQIYNAKNAKLVRSFREHNYTFSQDERFIAYFVRNSGVTLLSFSDSRVKYISESEYLWSINFSDNNETLIYKTFKTQRVPAESTIKATSIVDFTKNGNEDQKQIQKSKLTNLYFANDDRWDIKLYKLDKEGNFNLAIDFADYYGFCKSFKPNNVDSIIFIVKDYSIHVWSLNSLTELFTLDGHTNHISDIFINEDRTQIVSYSDDQCIKFWDYNSGKFLYSKLDLENGSLCFDAGYRFDCNTEIRDSIYFVLGTEIIKKDQVKDLCWEPGLVGKILGINKAPIQAKSLDEISIPNGSPVIENINRK